MIEQDLHQHFGIDVEQPGLLDGRTWRWLRTRIIGCLSVDGRLARAFAPPEPKNNHRGGGGKWR